MAIGNIVVEEDLSTIVAMYTNIESDDDFYYLRRVAQEMKLNFIATIDDAGDTIINRLQLPFFEQEIKELRKRSDINQKILDTLEEPIEIVKLQGPHLYIKFVGD